MSRASLRLFDVLRDEGVALVPPLVHLANHVEQIAHDARGPPSASKDGRPIRNPIRSATQSAIGKHDSTLPKDDESRAHPRILQVP
jgi:hypothetical protein